MMTVKRTLDRSRRYANPAHQRAVRVLAVNVAEQLDVDKTSVPYGPEKFLEVVLRDYIVLTR